MTKQAKQSAKTILIVEDEKSLQQALKAGLKKEGFKIITANDGVDGLEKSLKLHPDLVVLDILMPRMDGLTTLKKLRQDKWGAKARIVVLTNLSHPERETEAFMSNVNGYLIKSDWTLKEIINKIKGIV